MQFKILAPIVIIFLMIAFASLSPVKALSQPSLNFEPDEKYYTTSPCNNVIIEIKMDNNLGEPDCASVEYPAITAVMDDPALAEFVGPPHTAHVKIDGWEADVNGVFEMINFSWPPKFTLEGGPYPSVTWNVSESLPGDESLYINITVHCLAPGEVIIKVFPRATEDHHETAPLLSQIADKKNIWTPDGTHYYPVHNSYDNWDVDINSGHSWEPNSWTPKYEPSDLAYAKISIYITQTAVPEFAFDPYILVSFGAAAYLLLPRITKRKRK